MTPCDRSLAKGPAHPLRGLYAAGHAAYQAHPDHEVFRQQTVGFWEDIEIYDTLTRAF